MLVKRDGKRNAMAFLPFSPLACRFPRMTGEDIPLLSTVQSAVPCGFDMQGELNTERHTCSYAETSCDSEKPIVPCHSPPTPHGEASVNSLHSGFLFWPESFSSGARNSPRPTRGPKRLPRGLSSGLCPTAST